MAENKFSRGSEWRKWDLHIHSNASDGTASASEIINEAITNGLSVIALTDHHTVKNIEEIKQQGKEKNIEVIAGIEFRTEYGSNSVHMIGLFPDNLNAKTIYENILCPLGLSEATIIEKGKEDDKSKSDEAAFKRGMFLVQVDFKNAANLIHKYGGLVSVHAGSKANSVEQLKHQGTANRNVTELYSSLGTVKEELMSKYIDICEIRKENDNEDFYFEKFGKPSIIASDAHTQSEIGKKFVWLKADPTFEGLKQIIFEPKPNERIKIQQDKPDEKRGYQVIDSVILNEDGFWDNTVYLNENLNTIIGGRSTGKSTLLKAIAKKIDNKAKIEDEKDFIQNHLSGVTVVWKDGEETASRDIEFFVQSYMHDIAKDTEKTDALIKQVISNKEENKLLVEYYAKNNELKKSISKNILEVFQLQSDIQILQNQLKEKGDKKGVETEIQRLNTKIQELSKNATITQQELENFQDSLKEIAGKEQLIKQSDNDLFYLSTIINQSIIDSYYINEFDNLSSPIKDSIIEFFNKFSGDINTNWAKYIESINEGIRKQKQEYQTQIENIKSSDLYKNGTQYYNDNKELNDIQNKLKEENSKLQEIKGLEEKLNQLKTRRTTTITQIVTDHNFYHSNSQSLVQNLKIEHDEIKITTNISCKKQEIKSFLESRLNQRGNDRQQYVSDFADKYESDIANTSKEFLISALKNEIEYKNYNTNQNVITDFFTTNWFDISFELSYQNDVFSEMSQGKQAFVILKLLLEFSTKECPILIDQPEDSLDNRAIYNELVQYLRTKKKQRQIILVTHNPNVVVSADAENVIVANQNGKNSLNTDKIKFQYINGSLENTKQKDNSNNIVLKSQGIREHVCEILEGGKEAFENREKKYGFK